LAFPANLEVESHFGEDKKRVISRETTLNILIKANIIHIRARQGARRSLNKDEEQHG
jgi:hypothetical protein